MVSEELKVKAKELGIKSVHLYKSEEKLQAKIDELMPREKTTETPKKKIIEKPEEKPKKKIYRYKVLDGKVKVRSIRDKAFMKGEIIESPIKLPENFEIELEK